MFIDDPRVSRPHCAITFKNGQHYLEDLGSTNGTILNGRSLVGRAPIGHGDRFEVGDTELLFLTKKDPETDPPVYLDETPVDDAETVSVDSASLRLDALIDVANAFRNTRSMAAIQDKIISLIFSTIPTDRAAILLKDSDCAKFEIRFGRCRHEPRRSMNASQSIAERVYQTDAPILSNDLFRSGFSSIKSLKDANVRSLVCVPLSTVDRKYGVIYADTSDPFVRLENDHLAWLMAVATIAALALGTSAYIKEACQEISDRHQLIGESAAMQELRMRVAKVAPARSSVLILGESGTGKEAVARSIHLNSNRASGLFVAVNCATLDDDLVENELFGHESGAYTGALKQYRGKIERASGGTLFLDEVGELPLAAQAKLLRVLQEREIERLGGGVPIRVDIRLIAATNRDLESLIAKGRFREDLYYRLSVISIRTPSLRERPEDIAVLARHFLAKYAQETGRAIPDLSAEAEALLVNYGWPGNVRQLENAMEHAIVFGDSKVVRPEDLPLGASVASKVYVIETGNYHEFMKNIRIKFLKNALHVAKGDRKMAADLIGMPRSSVDRILRQLGMSVDVGEKRA